MTQHEPIAIPESEALQVAELHRLLELGAPALVGAGESERISLPPSIYRLLKDVVANLKRGKTVVLIPEDEALTTQMAANLLGVSRPHLVKLLETGRIPFARTGSHRRVLLKDVNAYAGTRDAERHEVINRMAKTAFDEGSYIGTGIPDGGEDA